MKNQKGSSSGLFKESITSKHNDKHQVTQPVFELINRDVRYSQYDLLLIVISYSQHKASTIASKSKSNISKSREFDGNSSSRVLSTDIYCFHLLYLHSL